MIQILNFCSISAGAGVIIPYLGEFYSAKKRDLAILTASIILGIICVLLPFLASLVINSELNIRIPFIEIVFKPWRLFMFISGVPNLITSSIIFFLPESPKFLCLAGRDGRRSYSENQSLWTQTKNLFSKKYLRLTITISVIHICAFALGGMGSWYPEIVNSVTSYIHKNETDSKTICEIFEKHLKTEKVQEVCVEEFEITTYSFVILSEVLFVLVMMFLSIAIKWISKPLLLSKCI